MSTLASLLGIDLTRITIVDVVPGNARRRHLLSESAVVDFEVEPSPEIELESDEGLVVLEDAGTVWINVVRSVNVVRTCSVTYLVARQTSDSAGAGGNLEADSGVLIFQSKEEHKKVGIQILSQPGYQVSDVIDND